MEFRLLIDADVLDAMRTMPVQLRRQLMDHFRRIQDFPENYEDFQERDSEGRRLGVSIFKGWAVKYWTDAADRHLKILYLMPADR